MTDDVPDNLGKGKPTIARRVELLERDSRSHARSLTAIVAQTAGGFTSEQMQQLRQVLREELADAGLRLDGPDHQDAGGEDFRFLRRLRQGIDGTAAKIGWLVIAAVVGGVIWIVNLGVQAWRAGSGA